MGEVEANMDKVRSSKLLRDRFPHLKGWCPDHLWAPSGYHGSVGHGGEVNKLKWI